MRNEGKKKGEGRGKFNGNAKRELDCQRALFSDRIKTGKIVSYRAPGAGRRFLSGPLSRSPFPSNPMHARLEGSSIFDLGSKCYETSHVASASNVSRLTKVALFSMMVKVAAKGEGVKGMALRKWPFTFRNFLSLPCRVKS